MSGATLKPRVVDLECRTHHMHMPATRSTAVHHDVTADGVMTVRMRKLAANVTICKQGDAIHISAHYTVVQPGWKCNTQLPQTAQQYRFQRDCAHLATFSLKACCNDAKLHFLVRALAVSIRWQMTLIESACRSRLGDW